MKTINFKCSECAQSLEVDAGHAGTAVACPECGQTVLVPHLARLAEAPSFPETPPFPEELAQPEPVQTRGWWPIILVIIALVLITGLLLLKKHVGTGTATTITPRPIPVIEDNFARNLVLYFNFKSEPTAGKVLI